MTKEKGGITEAEAIGDIPRNRRQVYNIKKPKSDENDALLSVMVMCKECTSEEDPFVRIVTSAPEPMCVMCTELQLADLERFCTGSSEFCPLSIDPTFNLGDFSVTVSSFRNLLLVKQGTRKHPVMIGPMLVHRLVVTNFLLQVWCHLSLVCVISKLLEQMGRSACIQHFLHSLRRPVT